MNVIFTLLLLSFSLFSLAQEDLAIGTWKTMLPLRESMALAQTPEKIVISSGRGLLFIDKEDFSYETFDKVDGLSETLIDQLVYDPFNHQLIISYKNSNIDFLKDGEILNVPDIKENQIIVGSREILDISVADAATCYFATSIGIIRYDLQKHEFKSTTFTNFPATSVSSDENFIYSATQEGLYRIEKNNPNIPDFSKWSFLSGNVGLPATYEAAFVKFFNGKIYVSIDGELYQSDGSTFSPIDLQRPSSAFRIAYLSSDGDHLIVGLKDNNVSSVSRFIDTNGIITSGGADCINRTLYGIEDQYGRIWYADEWRQIRYTDSLNSGCHRLEFDSPFSYECAQIEVMRDKVFFASGGSKENFTPIPNRSGLYILNNNNSWKNVNGEYFPILEQNNFISLISVAPHPKENKVFIASYLSGVVLYDLDSESIKLWGKDNSSLQTTIGDQFTTRVRYMKLDKDLNLWVTNFGAQKPISVFTKDSIWYSFSVPSAKELSKFTIDQSNKLWFAVAGNSAGILVMDHGESIEDPTDDKFKILNSTNSILEGTVNCIEVDLDGDVWVGTSTGPVVFECDVFDNNNCQGSRRKVLQDSIVAFLLETEDITAIEVDGANRKWFGTRNGIFVQSADGERQILTFNVENSPLLDNTIFDLDFDGNTGIMYISTLQGIQSIRTDATTGGNTHLPENVYAFPNPVRPDYFGPIAIKGLARDANVKITDINGKLIFDTKANGGQAVWDGNDYNGNRAATGVYLVFSSSTSNFSDSDSYVTKIMLIK